MRLKRSVIGTPGVSGHDPHRCARSDRLATRHQFRRPHPRRRPIQTRQRRATHPSVARHQPDCRSGHDALRLEGRRNRDRPIRTSDRPRRPRRSAIPQRQARRTQPTTLGHEPQADPRGPASLSRRAWRRPMCGPSFARISSIAWPSTWRTSAEPTSETRLPREGGRLTLFPPVPAKEGRRKNPPSATLQVTGIIGHGDKFAELRRASLLATSRSRPLDRSLPCYRWARVSRPGRSRSALAPAGWGPPDWDELRRRRCYRCSW